MPDVQQYKAMFPVETFFFQQNLLSVFLLRREFSFSCIDVLGTVPLFCLFVCFLSVRPLVFTPHTHMALWVSLRSPKVVGKHSLLRAVASFAYW